MNITYYTHNSQSNSFAKLMLQLKEWKEKVDEFNKFRTELLRNRQEDDDQHFSQFDKDR